MKILESSPNRYNQVINLITLGRLKPAYNHLLSYINRAMKILDIGCGTGILTFGAAEKGAIVKGIDINPEMLEIALERLKTDKRSGKLKGYIEFCEMGVVELESEKDNSYDAAVSGLCFSELSKEEIRFTLKQLRRIIKPGGLLLIADEIIPDNPLKRFVYGFFRIPLLLITYFLTGTTTRALTDFPEMVKQAGFEVQDIRMNKMGNFIELIAINPES